MSKNVYEVLETYDEHAQEVAELQKKQTKKEKREEDNLLRQHYQDVVPKEHHKPAPANDHPVKDDYAPGEKRPYDRHSGTGRQAFGNPQKKGGHGKGNEGKVNCKDYEGVVKDEENLEVESEDEVDENQTNPENPNQKGTIKKKKKKTKLKYDDKTFPTLEQN